MALVTVCAAGAAGAAFAAVGARGGAVLSAAPSSASADASAQLAAEEAKEESANNSGRVKEASPQVCGETLGQRSEGGSTATGGAASPFSRPSFASGPAPSALVSLSGSPMAAETTWSAPAQLYTSRPSANPEARKAAVDAFLREHRFEGGADGAKVTVRCGLFRSTYPLHQAAKLGDARAARALLQEGADVMRRDSKGRLAVQVARRRNKVARGNKEDSHTAVIRVLSTYATSLGNHAGA